MMITRLLPVFALWLVAGAAMAQSARKPLNLDLSPVDVPAAAGSGHGAAVAPAATGSVGKPVAPLPHDAVVRAPHERATPARHSRGASAAPGVVAGVWYGDHSADIGDDMRQDVPPPCDDSTYNQPHVHGSISTGIVSASHIGTGSYGSAVVNVSKAFGSCEHPGGGISIFVGGANSDGFGHHRGH